MARDAAVARTDSRKRPPPVRVKLRPVTVNMSEPYPPDGIREEWWTRLKNALATESSAFVTATLYQLQSAARLPLDGTSETAVNAALAMIEAAAPQNEIEAALAVQMACTHTAAMAVLARIGGGQGNERRVAAMGSAASRLLRAYTAQVEALRRLRSGGQQSIRVEHVTVNNGGQAIVGNIDATVHKGADRR